MTRSIHRLQRSFLVYDKEHVIVYLNEEVVENYVPEDAPEDTQPVTAYAYTGEESDGGTILPAAGTDRDSLINALIRKDYSQSTEDAIKTHQLLLLNDPSHEKAAEYAAEFSLFNTARTEAIRLVDLWLARQ